MKMNMPFIKLIYTLLIAMNGAIAPEKLPVVKHALLLRRSI
jgi:hypothetical protein